LTTVLSIVAPDFQALAARYGATERSVRRWDRLGVDVADALDVARHLVGIQHPTPAALEAATEILTDELSNPEP
jgi:hypothetical protein